MAKRSVRGRVIVGIVVGAMWLGIAAPSAFAYSVRQCDPIAEGDVSLAADYITRRVQRLGVQLLSTSGSLLGFDRPTQPDCPLAYPHDFREFLLKNTKLCESEIEQRDVLLKTKGVPSHHFGDRKNDEISRLYQKYYFD